MKKTQIVSNTSIIQYEVHLQPNNTYKYYTILTGFACSISGW